MIADDHRMCGARRSDEELLGTLKTCWITFGEVKAKFKHLIVYEDPGGDTFVKVFETKEQFAEHLLTHLKGGILGTNCDFATVDRLYMVDGAERELEDLIKVVV